MKSKSKVAVNDQDRGAAFMVRTMAKLDRFEQANYLNPESIAIAVAALGFPAVALAYALAPLHWLDATALAILVVALYRAAGAGGVCPYAPNLKGKVAIVTGSNTGIGFATALRLARWEAHVIIACRNAEKGKAAVNAIRADCPRASVEFELLDLASLDSVCNFTERWGATRRIDFLINNAGIMITPYRLTAEGFESQFGTNHVGHFVLTLRLLPTLKRCAARVINVSSIGHALAPSDIDWYNLENPKTYEPAAAYGWSKLANVLFSAELNRRHFANGRGGIAVSVHPGGVATELGRNLSPSVQPVLEFAGKLGFLKTPDEGAQTTLYCATAPLGELKGGAFYADCKEFTPTAHARSREEAVALWEASEELAAEYI